MYTSSASPRASSSPSQPRQAQRPIEHGWLTKLVLRPPALRPWSFCLDGDTASAAARSGSATRRPASSSASRSGGCNTSTTRLADLIDRRASRWHESSRAATTDLRCAPRGCSQTPNRRRGLHRWNFSAARGQ